MQPYELTSHKMTGRNLKGTLLRERSQSENTVPHRIPTVCHSGKGKAIEAEDQRLPEALGEGGKDE